MQFTINTIEQLDSTQTFLESRLSNQVLPEGYVVRAINQCKGHGQDGNAWVSESGQNLTFSLLLRPGFLHAARQFQLNIAIALGVADYLGSKTETHAPLALKWPNDFYLGRQKAGGMIMNNAVIGDHLDWCIAGIGLNINQQTFPADCPNPVSLKMLTKVHYSPEKELTIVLDCIKKRYSDLAQGHERKQKADYLALLYQFGIEASYIYKDHSIIATIKGVDEFGRLILSMNTGRQLCCDVKEIQYVL